MRVESRKLRVESQKSALGLRAHTQHSTLNTRPSRGFTLVELLVVILILSMLAALVLGVAAVAAETARQAKTKYIVQRLHTLLMEHYDTLKSRRVRLNPAVETAINQQPVSDGKKRQLLAEARLYAMRELILMEVPDRWSDVLLAAPGSTATPLMPLYLDTTNNGTFGRTPLAAAYLRRYLELTKNYSSAAEWSTLVDNQGAECLYLIITMACGDGEARSLFKDSDIGDTDGDGALEFLDGWGRPINFLRWAPGFDSQIQLNANNLQRTNANIASYWPTASAKDHDPFDVFRIDQNDPANGKPGAFRLVPLIYSAGRDETFGINNVKAWVTWLPNSSQPLPAGSMMPGYPRLSPYYMVTDENGNSMFLGSAVNDGTATDNIHNHLLGLR